MAELDVVLTRLDALDKRLGDQWQAVNSRLDDLGQRITALEARLTSAENRMASSLTVNVWGATISGLIATAVAVIKLWT
jgi:BMFP domain-containing protein YqiC